MKLKKYVQTAEIISALAIILSLIFVGVQLNGSTRATRSATASATISTFSAWYVEIGNSQQSSALVWTGLVAPEELTREEWFQFVMNLHGLMLNFQNSYYLANEGTLDEEVQQSLTEVIFGIKDQPGFLRYWNQRRSIFFEEFQGHVDMIIASKGEASKGLFTDPDSDKEALR